MSDLERRLRESLQRQSAQTSEVEAAIEARRVATQILSGLVSVAIDLALSTAGGVLSGEDLADAALGSLKQL